MIDYPSDALYPSALADLSDGSLLQILQGERLWKLYFLRPAQARRERVEHRIYTKEQVDGRIGLVSYSLRILIDSRPSRSQIAVAHDIPKDALNQLIWNVVRQCEIGPDELEIIDLSSFPTLAEQMRRLHAAQAQAQGVQR